jgi:molybdate/tungstate transport system ATP-binding protein
MINLKNVCVAMGDFKLNSINLEIGKGEYFVILGPSGAGKTVLLEVMAGLRSLKSGEVWINGNNATQLSPEKRKIGYVPQDYVLFPFLNVYDNIAFGLREVNCPGLDVDKNVKRLVELLGISHLLKRNVRTLSGGEKQRISLARALVLSPKVLLLDEPLSNLDLQTAKYLRVELKRVHHELGVTMVHVTHNQSEAEELADQIGVLNLGKLEQVGRPEEVFFYPENAIVSDFIGTPNILNCDSCRPIGQGLVEADCSGLRIIIPHDEDEPVKRIAIFPRDIYISEKPPPGPSLNRFKGKLIEIKPMGSTVRLNVSVGNHILFSEMPLDIFNDMELDEDQEIFLILKLRRIRIF